MSNDVLIKRRRVEWDDENNNEWEMIAYESDCPELKDFVLKNIPSKEEKVVELDINDIHTLTRKIFECMFEKKNDFKKALGLLSQLTYALYEHEMDKDWEGIEYEYVLDNRF